MNIKWLFLSIVMLTSHLVNATEEAFFHSHGGRSHSHLLPQKGLNHSHNDGKKGELNELSIKKIIIYDDGFSRELTTASKQNITISSTLSECKKGTGKALITFFDEKGKKTKAELQAYKLDSSKSVMNEICADATKSMKASVFGVLYPKSIEWEKNNSAYSMNGSLENTKENDVIIFSGSISDCQQSKGKFSVVRDIVDSMNIQFGEHVFDLDGYKGSTANIIAAAICSVALESHKKL